MNEDPTGTIYDSTSNGNDLSSAGSMTSGDLVEGHVGRAIDFDGTDDYLSNTGPSGYGTPGDYTLTVWFYNTSQSGYSNFYSHTTSNGDFDPQWTFNNSTVTLYDGSAITLGSYASDNDWHRIDFVRSGSTVTAYIDGVSNGTGTHSDTLGVATEIYIANSGDTRTEFWLGPLDEIRYSETARDIHLIRTEYNNQNNPSSFMSFNSEEVYKYIYKTNLEIDSLPDSNSGYKWQVMACDDDSACSSWSVFNAITPNIKVDAQAPTAPGNLSLNSQTASTITINFGSQTTENNFTEYRIYYKLGSSGVSESDSEWASSSDANLGYIDYNGATDTTITGLSAGSEYVFNIWAYDSFGRKASATSELVASTNYPPTATFISAKEKRDASGIVDISIQADDGNDDNLRAKLEYVAGSACDFSSPLDPTLDETDENATSTYGDAQIENDNEYQIGNSSGWIITASGTNIINFDWLSQTDLPTGDGTYCLRLTAYDGVDTQVLSATTTLVIDNVAPSTPGDLSLNSQTGTSLTLNFGTETTETNFKEYKIFYKEGVASVDENDLEHSDTDLGFIDYNGTATTTVSGLQGDTQYSFKIYAYDDYGNQSNSSQVTFTTNAPPTISFNSANQRTNGEHITDISIEVYDKNGDDCEVKIDYVAGSDCDFSSPLDPTLDETPANISADFGTVGIANSETYQIGTATAMVLTSSGSNTVNFDWSSGVDLPSGDGTYCLRLIATDGTDLSSEATTTLIIDNVNPTAPGNLSVESVSGLSVSLNFGSASTDNNFKEYKIFYKEGTSGVTESDSSWTKNDDSDLGFINYNGTATTSVYILTQNTDYVFNIWVYDDFGNKASAGSEVSTTTLVIPSATWREAEDTVDPTLGTTLEKENAIRLRLAIANSGDWPAENYHFLLEYALKGTDCASISSWTTVPVSASGEHFQMITSPYFANMSSTTQKLSDDGYDFVQGYIMESPSNMTNAFTLGPASSTELEYVFEPTGTALSGETYCFRATNNGDALDLYVDYPELTLAPPPSGSFNSATQKTDGSKVVDISIKASDTNGDDLKAKIEYVLGASCDFSSPLDPTLDETSANISADYGSPIITNANTYQIGTTSGWIVTSYGENNVNFDWDTLSDLTNADDTYCLRLTVNDGYEDQEVPATTTLIIDHVDPTTPGDLSQVDVNSNSVTLGLGTSSVDTHFKEYRIYYKEGSSGVTESDNLWGTSSDPNLAFSDYNGATTTTITGLETNKQYVFRIWAYDIYDNKKSSSNEISITIRYVSRSESWRWYYDDLNETPSSTNALALENNAPSGIAKNIPLRLRFALREIEDITGENVKIRLEYSTYSDFSADVHFVGELGSTTALWTYTDGSGDDNDPVLNALLSGITNGATHNESGISTSSYDHLAGTAAEWEFTIRNSGAINATTYYFRAYDNTNGGAIINNTGFSYPSLITGESSLSYEIQGINSGSSTEGVITNINSSVDSIDFGNLSINNEVIGAQRLVITTNAGYGYQLFIKENNGFISNAGADIDPVSSTNEVPASWSENPYPSAFGYHSGDDTLSGSSPSRFSPDDTYAQFSTTPKEVSYSPIPVQNEIVDVIYRVEADNIQEAGDYETDIVYILVPTFQLIF